jgi:AAA15 family ATPase/GTPase
MLIEFNAANYRSLKTSQTLNMVATKDTSLQATNCMPSGMHGIPQLLRAAILYGANASGKSNLISALVFMRNMVALSATTISEGQKLNASPFRFAANTLNQPAEFEITFIENNIRYQYGFSLNSLRVVKEWLFANIGSKAQCWFERIYDDVQNKDIYKFGSHLMGGKQRNLWRDSTRGNALFLSTAVHLNSEQLRPIFNWFVNKLVIVESTEQLLPFYTMECVKNEEKKSQIIKLLKAADFGITNVEIKMQKHQQVQFRVDSGVASVNSPIETELPSATLSHQGNHNDQVDFELREESHGTQRIFAYAGPLLDVLQEGKIFIVDELDCSLHPNMVRFLLNLIQNPELNQNNAQLIFTTHNTSLLDTELFRRDQIWFMEKDSEQSSHLYPLTDFSPRKAEAIEKGYLLGRYGALPFLGEFTL